MLFSSISSANSVNGAIDIKANTFLSVFSCIFSTIGSIAYISISPDIPKNSTDLKQIYPLIFPKFHISVL